MIERRTRDLPMFNLAIDSKLRGCDVVALKIKDVAPGGYTIDRATVRQRKTGRPVKFEPPSRREEGRRISVRPQRPERPRHDDVPIRTARVSMDRQHRLDAKLFGTHSLRRTKATLIYRRTGNLRAVQLLLGHTSA